MITRYMPLERWCQLSIDEKIDAISFIISPLNTVKISYDLLYYFIFKDESMDLSLDEKNFCHYFFFKVEPFTTKNVFEIENSESAIISDLRKTISNCWLREHLRSALNSFLAMCENISGFTFYSLIHKYLAYLIDNHQLIYNFIESYLPYQNFFAFGLQKQFYKIKKLSSTQLSLLKNRIVELNESSFNEFYLYVKTIENISELNIEGRIDALILDYLGIANDL
jgi:hypothetical protein